MRHAVYVVAVLSGFIASSAADTYIKYCQDGVNGPTCQFMTASNGVCYNVAGGYNDRVESVSIGTPENLWGQCVFWEDYNCKNDHTDMVTGVVNDMNSVCIGDNWRSRISSFKCCDTVSWCAGSRPNCT
ncbi:uncharacterized protein DNG_07554 [Cephalotrichum gorgonifer]|uniref:Uncharacterized protein n=1 Tax=Cephalotrichum gorgonifer TaxID=2041049 RepID=A0AAE8N3M3_9PEZI|nr:uncharacterized protein DNG_07554 [Cephalotrichum gorgonifer]